MLSVAPEWQTVVAGADKAGTELGVKVSFDGPDNETQVDKLGEMIGGAGKVAVIAHSQTSLTGIDRRDGFLDEIKARFPGIEVVAVEYGDGDHLKSTEITKAILAAKVTIVGFESGKAQKDAIREGLMAGAITRNPIGIGYETVKAAVAASRGETLPKVIDTGFYWYDKSTIDDPTVAAVLYD